MARVLSKQTIDAINEVCKRYPTRLAAMLPALHLAQKQLGHISSDAELDVAEVLDVPPTRVREVVTFYTMYYDHPVGRHVVKICRNLACELRGANRIMAHAEKVLGIKMGETTADGMFTLQQSECLGACADSPVMLVNDRTMCSFMSNDKLDQLVDGLKGAQG